MSEGREGNHFWSSRRDEQRLVTRDRPFPFRQAPGTSGKSNRDCVLGSGRIVTAVRKATTVHSSSSLFQDTLQCWLRPRHRHQLRHCQNWTLVWLRESSCESRACSCRPAVLQQGLSTHFRTIHRNATQLLDQRRNQHLQLSTATPVTIVGRFSPTAEGRPKRINLFSQLQAHLIKQPTVTIFKHLQLLRQSKAPRQPPHDTIQPNLRYPFRHVLQRETHRWCRDTQTHSHRHLSSTAHRRTSK